MQAAERVPTESLSYDPWLTPPNLMTLSRLPLALALWAERSRPRVLLALMALAGLSDLADGWLARRMQHGLPRELRARPRRGAWLDPLCDKIFVSSALGVAIHERHPPLGVALAVLTREILLAAGLAASKTLGPRRPHRFETAPIGKVTTVAQYATVAALLTRSRLVVPVALIAAVAGLGAATIYIGRELTAR